MITTIQTIGKHFIIVYLSPYPYILYNKANNHANMAFAGVGLGLIQCQQTFWISNIGMTFLFFNSSNMYYSNDFFYVMLFFLYGFSFLKSYYLTTIFFKDVYNINNIDYLSNEYICKK